LKNFHRRQFHVTLFLLLGLILLSSCRLKNTPQESLLINTPVVQPATTSVTENQYPSTPEEVIKAFLISYPTDQVFAVQYLSPAYVSTLDAESASKLLPASGDISGFIIEKGDTSSESEKSEILTNIAFQNMSSEVQFNLIIVDGRWVIDKILAK
jgi:hypothetical protein